MKLFSRVVSTVLATVMVFSGLTITNVFAADTLSCGGWFESAMQRGTTAIRREQVWLIS